MLATSLPSAELRKADEIFINQHGGGVIPVTILDSAVIADGRPGPVTQAIYDFYWRRHDEGWKSTPVDYGVSA